MRRALCLIGFSYFIAQILLFFAPSATFGLLAAFLVLLCIITFYLRKKQKYFLHVLVISVTCLFAIIFRIGYCSLFVTPVQTLEGETCTVQAEVVNVRASYLEDAVFATVEVKTLEQKPVTFRTQISLLPTVEVGDFVSAQVTFSCVAPNEYRLNNYAKGIYIMADYEQDFILLGQSNSRTGIFLRLQKTLSQQLYNLFSQDIAAIAAAMSLGDKSNIATSTSALFNKVGLSHLLVVSGLHMSMISGFIYLALSRFLSRRKTAMGSIVVILVFMCLVGFTPSVVRAGVVMICVHAGALMKRRSDILTSLAAALLILCVMNPFAAVDMGLLLSFSATLGVLWIQQVCARWLDSHPLEPWWQIVLYRICSAVLIAVVALLVTLPILISMGGGISVLSIICNLLCSVPAGAVAFLGIVTALCSLIPPLSFITYLLGLFCGLLIRWILFVVETAAAVPGLFVHITGSYAMWITGILCILIFAAWKFKILLQKALMSWFLFLAFAASIYFVSDANVVHYAMTGSGQNQPVIITQGLQTVVIFRGGTSNVAAVWDYLEQQNRTQINLLVDLRREGDTQALAAQFYAKESFSVQQINNNAIITPFRDIIIYAKHQTEGNFVCVDVGGHKTGIAAGSVDFSAYPPFDIYCGGSGTPQGLQCDILILPPSTKLSWVDSVDAVRYQGLNTSQFSVRSGGSIRIKEIANDFE